MSMFDTSPNFINRNKGVSSRLQTGGVYVAFVTRSDGQRVYVRVPKLGGTSEYGPCLFNGIVPAVDERVLVGFLDNQLTELIVFGTLTRAAAPIEDTTFTGTITLPSTTSIGNVSSVEVGYLNGLTGDIQSQLDTKAPKISPTFSGTVVLPSATSIGDVTSTELGYLDNVTSSIQTQIDSKLNKQRVIVANPSTSLMLSLIHISNVIECSSSTATVVTIPTEASVNFPIGTEINISSVGTGTVSVARATTAVTANGSTSTSTVFRLRAQWSVVTLLKRDSNNWHVFGDFYTV